MEPDLFDRTEKMPTTERAAHPTPAPQDRTARASNDSRWVLITDDNYGKASGSVAAVRSLAAAGYHPAVAFSTPISLAASSRYCRRQIRMPSHRSKGYAAAIAAELNERPYLTLLPTTDIALRALDRPEVRFLDKAELARLAERSGLGTPPTKLYGSTNALLADAGLLDYPVMIKPAVKHAARVAHGPDDLAWWADWPGEVLVQPFLRNEQEYGVAGLVWKGEMVASVRQRHIRTWPPEAGSTCAAETIATDPEIEAGLLRLLDGYDGIFQADFMGPYLIDVNPRVYASLLLALAAGANLVGLYCDLLRGRTVEPVRARPGVFYRWLDADMRNLAAAWRGNEMGPGEVLRELRPRRGTVYALESRDDWRPTVARLRYGITTGRWRRIFARS